MRFLRGFGQARPASVGVSLADRRARVQYVEGKVTADSIAAAVRKLGYKTGEPVAENDP